MTPTNKPAPKVEKIRYEHDGKWWTTWRIVK